jgi:hypothetical protein
MFPVYGGKSMLHKAFITGSRNVANVLLMTRKLLRQQSKDFDDAGFDALVKRWDKYTNIGGGYVEK